MRSRLLPIAMIAACHHGPPEVTAAQWAEIDQVFVAADAQDAAADRAFRDAIAAATSLAPGDAPCATKYERGDDQRYYESLGRWVTLRQAAPGGDAFQAGRVGVAQGEKQLAVLTSAARALRRDDERALRAREKPFDQEGGAELVARAHAIATAPPGPELLIVIASIEDPDVLDATTFSGGAAVGRAFLYDPAAGRVACVGDVGARSSGSVWSMDGLAQSVVSADLFMKLIEAAEQSLRAPGPASR